MTTRDLTEEENVLVRHLLADECDYVLPTPVMDKFLSKCRVVEIDKWDSLIEGGDMNPDVYISFEGMLRSWYWNDDKEITASFSTVPTLIMNYHTYYGKEGSFYNIQACTPCKLLRCRQVFFDDLIANSHEFARWQLRLAHRQLYYFEIKSKLNTGLAIDRYKRLVRELPDIMHLVPLHTVATYLGITPQHLSRLRRSVRDGAGSAND